jgi:MFS family permease
VAGGVSVAETRASLARVGARVAKAWTLPGTRAGFWVHFTAMSTSLTFGVLWGVPFLISAQGMSRTEASSMLLLTVVASVAVSPVIGYLTGRYPSTRVPLAIGVCIATVCGWALVLAAFSSQVPRPLLVVVIVITGLGGPTSTIGFALARDYNGPAIVGTATGVVNVGGFVAGIVGCLAIGWALDVMGTTDTHAYRIAFALAVLVQAAGLVQLVRWWLRARASVLAAQELGETPPVALVRHRWDLGG